MRPKSRAWLSKRHISLALSLPPRLAHRRLFVQRGGTAGCCAARLTLAEGDRVTCRRQSRNRWILGLDQVSSRGLNVFNRVSHLFRTRKTPL